MADKTDGSRQPAEPASASRPGPGQEAGEWGEAGAWDRPAADVSG